MRPHLLSVTAFGSFAATSTVNFDALADGGLFLISGPTGSGKTSLLDAMTYALYGAVPGTRAKDELASHFPADHDPQVSLEFTAGGSRWRATRTPVFERPKRRGTGSTTQAGSARLQRRDTKTWTTVATKAGDVTERITDLVGLTADQFKRVILLPQNQFALALEATHDEREALLRRLFDTERFDHYTRRLVEDSKAADALVCEHARDQEERRRHAERRWSTDISEPTPALPDDPADWDQADLEALTAAADDLAKKARKDERSARKAKTKADTAHTKADAQAQRWDLRKSLVEQRTLYTTRANAVDAQRSDLADAQRAEPLRVPYDDRARCRLASDAAHIACAGPLRDAADLCEDLPASWDQLARGVQASVDEAPDTVPAKSVGAWRRKLAAAEAGIASVLERYDEASGATEAASLLRSQAAELTGEANTLEDEASGLETQIESWQSQLDDAAQAERDLPRLEADAVRLAAIASDTAKARQLTTRQRQAQQDLRKASADAESALETSRRLVRDRLEDMAAELASRLSAGEPCTVCGSSAHPAPAEFATHPVTAEAVMEAQDHADHASETARAYERTVAALDTEIAALTHTTGKATASAERAARAAAGAAKTAAENAGDLAAGSANARLNIETARSSSKQITDRITKARQEAAGLLAADHAHVNFPMPAH